MGKNLTEQDFKDAAESIGCEVAAIKAVSVLPEPTVLNGGNDGFSYEILACDLSCPNSIREQSANLSNLRYVQFAPPILTQMFLKTPRILRPLLGVATCVVPIPRLKQAISLGVRHVFGMGVVFKVGLTIISLLRVFVINLMVIRAYANKSCRNQDVNIPRHGLLWFTIKIYGSVASIVRTRLQDATNLCRVFSLYAFDAPEARHFVKSLEANNRTPFFGFKFFGGKLILSHDVNLRSDLQNWSGSFTCSNRCASRLYFNTI